MRLRRALGGLGCGLTFLGVVYAFQRPFKEYPGTEYYDFQLPADFAEKTEWVFGRLMYPPGPLDGYSRTGRFTGDFRRGLSL